MKQFAYVGCRTTKERKARGKGIRIFEIENGTWKPVGLLEGPVNPSYFCLNEAQDMLYAIHGDYSEVSAYRIQPDGNIVYCNTVGTHGTNPVHLVLDRSGKLTDRRGFTDSGAGGWKPWKNQGIVFHFR